MITILKKQQIVLSFAVIALLATLFFGVRTTHGLVSTTMGPGDSGAEVSELQTFLALDSAVYPEGLVTGYYGDLTTSAVTRFQCKQSIVCSGSVETTGYGRVGPQTLASIRALQGSTNPGPQGGDLSAPILGEPSVATTSTSASISWITNEPARSRVMYGTSWPFLLAAAPSYADITFDATSAVVIPSLFPNTTYYYVRESIDASGNTQYGIGTWFRTASN